ncbi:Forkhead transcription factor [Tilletia horrida]|nr:Forkhead transcription factor [Tilletia horrida]KAK0540632.1 Forkhead transcription factor [Tilletia horrida]KAK0560457.1 Forkhead transcription factor [Tilletia horrida]
MATADDLYARAQAMGLKLSREDLERTRAGIAAIVKPPRTSPSSSIIAHAPASSSPSRNGPLKKVTTPHSVSSRHAILHSSGGSSLAGPRPTLEQVSLRKEQDGEDRRKKRQRRKSEGTPSQALFPPDASYLLGSSSSRLIDFSSPYSQSFIPPFEPAPAAGELPHPQYRWVDRSGRPRIRARPSLDEVSVRAEEGSQEKRKARRRRRTGEDSCAELTDTDSIRPDEEDMLPLLLALPTPDVSMMAPPDAEVPNEIADVDAEEHQEEAHQAEDEVAGEPPGPQAFTPQLATPFRGQAGVIQNDLALLEGPHTPIASPMWWPKLSSPLTEQAAPQNAAEHDEQMPAAYHDEALSPVVEAIETEVKVLADPETTSAAQAEAGPSNLTKSHAASPRRQAEAEEAEPDARPRKRRKKARISVDKSISGPSSEAYPAQGDEGDTSLSQQSNSASEEFLEAWDYSDGTRVVKLISEELAHALRAGTLTEDEVEPRYFTLPVHWGKDKTKPSHASYAGLIGLAILSSSDGKLGLAEIYRWINTTFPFYEMRDRGWQNSIRHNLSLNKSFIKVERNSVEKGKGALWSIQPGHECRFENGTYNAKKAVMSKPMKDGAAAQDATDNEADDEADADHKTGFSSSQPAASSSSTSDFLALMKKHGGSQVICHTLQHGSSHKFYRQKRDPAADVALGLAVSVVQPGTIGHAAGNASTGDARTAISTPQLGGDTSLPATVPASQESVRTDTSAYHASGSGAPHQLLPPLTSTPAPARALGNGKRGGRAGVAHAGPSSSSSSSRLAQALSKAETAAARAAAKVGMVAASKDSSAVYGAGADTDPVKPGPAARGRKRVPLKDKTNLGGRAGAGAGVGRAGGTGAAAATAGGIGNKGKGKARATDDGDGGAPEMERGSSSSEMAAASTSETSSNIDAQSPEAMRVRSSQATSASAAGAAARRGGPVRGHGHPPLHATPLLGSSLPSASSGQLLHMGLGAPSPSHILGQPMMAGPGMGGPFAHPSLGSNSSAHGAVAGAGAGPNGAAANSNRWPMRSPISSLRSSMGAVYGGLGAAAGMDGVNFLSSRHQLSPLRGSPLRPGSSAVAGGASSAAAGASGAGAAAGAGAGAGANTAGALKNGSGSVMLPIVGLTPARRILAGHAGFGSSFSPLQHTPGGLGSSIGMDLGMGLGMGGLGMSGLRSMGIGANTGLGNVMSPVHPLSGVLQTPGRSTLNGSATGSVAGDEGSVGGRSGMSGSDRARRRRESSGADGPGGAASHAASTGGPGAAGGNGPLSHNWFFSSTPIRRLMGGGAGSDHAGSPTSASVLDRNGSPYARGSKNHHAGGAGGSNSGRGAAGGAGGRSAASSSSGDGPGSSQPASSLGSTSTPSAAVSGAGASTGFTPGGEAHWLGDPFGYQGNFTHELAFTTDMGGFGTGIDSSPAKDMWR